jgi:acetylornithine deacetylase/succinyl-diaminopimelate desuccinylase-like protein
VTRGTERAAQPAAVIDDPDGPVKLASDLVAAASSNPPGDERAAAAVLVTALRELGIDDVQEIGPSPHRRNVIARVPGRGGGRSLILNGHIDTKPPGDLDAWETPPWEPTVRDGRLYGLGAADMKGAVAAMAFAAAEVARAELAGDLVLMFTADEEEGSACGARWLAEQGMIAADAAIVGEPSGLANDWDAIRLVSRGVFLFRVNLEGTSMHSSLSDHLPSVNASVEMARLVSRLADEGATILRHRPHPLAPGGPTLNVALVAQGGSGQGVLPGAASFVSDVRALPGMERDEILGDVKAFLARAAEAQPGLWASVQVDAWLPPCEIDPAHPVVRALAEASAEVLGTSPPFAVFPGGTDAPHFHLTAGVPTVPSCGPGLLTAAHRPNESITLRSIVEATAIYAGAAKRFLGG